MVMKKELNNIIKCLLVGIGVGVVLIGIPYLMFTYTPRIAMGITGCLIIYYLGWMALFVYNEW